MLCLDADERVTPALATSIRAAMDKPDAAAYAMARRNRFLGRWLAHGEGYPGLERAPVRSPPRTLVG